MSKIPFYRVSGYMTPADAIMGRKASRYAIMRYWLRRWTGKGL